METFEQIKIQSTSDRKNNKKRKKEEYILCEYFMICAVSHTFISQPPDIKCRLLVEISVNQHHHHTSTPVSVARLGNPVKSGKIVLIHSKKQISSVVPLCSTESHNFLWKTQFQIPTVCKCECSFMPVWRACYSKQK